MFADASETDKLANLCERLTKKHAGEPVILFIDENDITSSEDFPKKVCLKRYDNFFVISAISPILENNNRTRGSNFHEMDIVKDENCMFVNLYLRYRNSRVIQRLCRNVGKGNREEVYHRILN